jgi:hypothetical protein
MGADIKSLAMRVLQRHGAVPVQSQPLTVGETPVRLSEAVQTQPEDLGTSQTNPTFPTRRCRMCKGWLYWVSVHGAVICAGCHAPASRALIKAWYWLPEGEARGVQ